MNFKHIEDIDVVGFEMVDTDNNDIHIYVDNGMLTINGIENHINVSIYDMQGRMVHCGTERTVTGIPSGIYIVKAGSTTAKLAI